MAHIPNSEFLDRYMHSTSANGVHIATSFILPIDEILIEQRLADIQERRAGIAAERTEIAAQSGDTWHDGAFRESDMEVNAVDKEFLLLTERSRGDIVDYPEEDVELVTLGSRISVDNSGRKSILDIVGLSTLHKKVEGEATPASLEAPIVKLLIGKRVGETALLHVGRKPRTLEIEAIDQVSIRLKDEQVRGIK